MVLICRCQIKQKMKQKRKFHEMSDEDGECNTSRTGAKIKENGENKREIRVNQ